MKFGSDDILEMRAFVNNTFEIIFTIIIRRTILLELIIVRGI